MKQLLPHSKFICFIKKYYPQAKQANVTKTDGFTKRHGVRSATKYNARTRKENQNPDI